MSEEALRFFKRRLVGAVAGMRVDLPNDKSAHRYFDGVMAAKGIVEADLPREQLDAYLEARVWYVNRTRTERQRDESDWQPLPLRHTRSRRRAGRVGRRGCVLATASLHLVVAAPNPEPRPAALVRPD
jgi:hypothetical protein